MAQTVLIPITDDLPTGSPATGPCTNYYEVQYRLSAQAPWSNLQVTPTSPLPEFSIGSPAVSTPCISIPNLADNTLYYYQLRRWCCDGNSSAWVTGTFTTGS